MPKNKKHVIGIGLDNPDGHKRITQAEDFTVVGGSSETHGLATEHLIKTTEELKKRGKTIANSSREDFKNAADEAYARIKG